MKEDKIKKRTKENADKIYKILEINFHKSEESDKWLVENYNSTSRDFSERLTWLAGIGIGLIPLIFEYLYPVGCKQILLITTILTLLLFSIFMGGIDFILSLKFWDKSAGKNKKQIDIWYNAMIDAHANYPDDVGKIYYQALKVLKV